MGKSRLHFKQWHNIADIINFSFTLIPKKQTAFLVVFSAFAGLFGNLEMNKFVSTRDSTKQLELWFYSLYLIYLCCIIGQALLIKKQCKDLIPLWMLEEIEAIPLRVWDPEDSQLVLFQYPDEHETYSE